MKITQILINHMLEPLGFQLEDLRIEFKIEANTFVEGSKKLTIWTTDEQKPVYQTEMIPYDNNYFDVPITLNPRTKYQVKVTFNTTNNHSISAETFFETGKMNEDFKASWIANSNKNIQNTLFKKSVKTTKEVAQARLYMTGLGIYETYINGEKISDEYLAPGVTAYNQWIQVQTYDITESLKEADDYELLISTADGWYKGIFGFEGGKDKIYGDQHMAIAEYHLTYTDGSKDIFLTDDTWQTTSGNVTKSAIYYGEDLDDNIVPTNWQPVILLDHNKNLLKDRLSLPLKINENLSVKEIIRTPADEQVLDFGQNQAGWLEFYNREPKGTKLIFQMSEILQEGNFYRDNLRDARAAFVYISDGEEKWVRPHFTYYGYRYVKVEGNTKKLEPKDFRAAVMFSEMSETGSITTDNDKVNRLFENIIWGQKGNFFDVPTDCPQRDERLGWTGDANVFSNTASFNMNVFQFFKKFAKDIAVDQVLLDGMVPMYAPAMGNLDGGSAVWGDAATIIPWNMFQTYGDPAILKQNYSSMKSWVDWITSQTKITNLWTGSFQFGDWLALDGENPALPTGKTEEDFIASVYYYYSTSIVSKTAKILDNFKDANFYAEQSEQIKKAISREYITETGRLAIDTQTAYALALQFELVPENQIQRVLNDLVKRLEKDNNHLKTGFVGTPFICQVLSKYGEHKLATKIFLLDDSPSWLYAVNMGATTVWERWNSVEPDGSMNPEGMNSLNHYSFGAIMEWGYKYLLGIKQGALGYQEINFEPEFDYRLKKINGHFDTSYGDFIIDYEIEKNKEHLIEINLAIPFGMTAHVNLPRATKVAVTVNGKKLTGGQFDLTAGNYQISYIPTEDYVERYNAESSVAEIMRDEQLVAEIDSIDPVLDFFRKDPNAIEGGLGTMNLTKLNTILPFININPAALEKINELLSKTPLLSERKESK